MKEKNYTKGYPTTKPIQTRENSLPEIPQMRQINKFFFNSEKVKYFDLVV